MYSFKEDRWQKRGRKRERLMMVDFHVIKTRETISASLYKIKAAGLQLNIVEMAQ